MNKSILLLCATITTIAHTATLEFTPLEIGNYSEQVVHEVTYGIYHAPIEHVSLHWKDKQGNAYGGLRALKNVLERSGKDPVFLMNAGIYSKDYRPAGLWIEQGNTLSALNTNDGHGNFHLQPNGVFLIHDQKAQIISTSEYQTLAFQPDYAVQSGPMLLIDGQINDRFIKDIVSPYKRNAVCLTKEGQLYFIMSIANQSQWPNFYHFSQALQSFSCQQALYLDGTISAWYIKDIKNSFHWSTFVGIIAVTSE